LFASILIPPAASSPLPSAAPREVITSADRAYDAATGVLRRWQGIESRQIDGDPARAARAFLEEHAAELGLEPGLDDVEAVAVRRGLGTTHVRLRQTWKGIPVFASDMVVSQSRGVIRAVASDYWPGLAIDDGGFTLARDEAIAIAEADRGARPPYLYEPCGQVYALPLVDPPRLAWRVILKPSDTPAMWEVFVDARSGKVLSARDLTWYVDGSGYVFDPDPLTTAHAHYDDPGFTDGNDASTAELNGERKIRVLKDIIANGGLHYLLGPYVNVCDIEPPWEADFTEADPDDFRYTRTEQGFEAVMAYYHIDTLQRWIQSLGFDDVNNETQEADPHGLAGISNAHYCPRPGVDCLAADYMAFGEGVADTVDTAEDADMILHEYGHAIQDDQVPGWGIFHETGSMGEGFSDYISGSYSWAIDPFEGNWWAQWWNMGGGGNPGVRPLNGAKLYPDSLRFEVHDDGEIWSACLWQIHQALGRAATDRLVIQSHFYLLPGASFRDGAEAILQADADMNAGVNDALIRGIFQNRGILRAQPFDVSLSPSEIRSSVAFEYEVEGYQLGREYMVVWEDGRWGDPDIYAARVAPSGAVIRTDRPLAVTPDSETYPDVAHVPWISPNELLYSRFLTSYIRLEPAIMLQNARVVRTNWMGNVEGDWVATNGVDQNAYRTAIASVNDGSGRTLMVWIGVTGTSPWEVRGAWVNSNTGVVNPGGFQIFLSNPGTVQVGYMLDVAYSGSNFLVVWEVNRNDTTGDIQAAIVGNDGAIGARFPIARTAAQETWPAVAYDTTSTRFVVTWQRRTADRVYACAARVTTAGSLLDPGGIVVADELNTNECPAVSSGISKNLITWRHAESNTLRGRMLDAVTGTLDPLLQIAPLAGGWTTPATAFDGMTHLVTWDDGEGGSSHIRGCIVRGEPFPDVPIPGEIAEAPPAMAARARLDPPFPNPTRCATTLRVVMPAEGPGSVRIFDPRGRLVRVLAEGWLPGGPSRLVWDGMDGNRRLVPAGIYFVRVATSRGTESRTIVVAR
ncbi:MAG: T9SS type A sorting domain-containing protein, partial [Candidatus Eisenbacteria bacterium]|nr:T9SS type A sorting domain-containing protein [Candidatus Eisenbacteria bacterium]